MSLNLLHSSDFHHLIDWPLIQKDIQKYAYFDQTRNYLGVPNFFTEEAINTELKNIELLYSLRNAGNTIHLHQIFHAFPQDIRFDDLLLRLQKVAFLNLKELNFFILAISAFKKLKKEFFNTDLPLFEKIQHIELPPALERLIREFRYVVDESGELDLNKHPELSQLAKQLNELEEKIRRELNFLINNPDFNSKLQFLNFDVINEHYVIPVRTDSFESTLGFVIAKSESGHTLFVEPFVIRDLNFKRLELLSKIEEILNLICRDFTEKLHSFFREIKSCVDLILDFDNLWSRFSYSFEHGFSKPTISPDNELKLFDFFHPMIKNPVKNNIIIEQHNHGILLSGPNTGGKTVALKATVLSYLFLHSGFFINAKEATMGLYSGIFYLGLDQQNLTQGLSSFSGEVQNFERLLTELQNTNLVFVDEIFNSTSSEEASVLAWSIVEYISQRFQCHFFISTHHQLLKKLCHESSLFVSASVGFDPIKLTPTYKVNLGTPGQSMAINIFQTIVGNTDFSSIVSNIARSLMNETEIQYEKLIDDLQKKNFELQKLIEENTSIQSELRNREKSLEGLVKLRLQSEIEETQSKLRSILQEGQDLLEQARSNPELKEKTFFHKKLSVEQKIKSFNQKNTQELNVTTLAPSTLKIGEFYVTKMFSTPVKILEIDHKKQIAKVQRGVVTMNVPLENFIQKTGLKSKPNVKVQFSKTSDSKCEYDCRGMRLSEFETIIEKAIADLLIGEIPYLNIVHGHGDGILKKWLRDHLSKMPAVEWKTPDNGNDGETQIKLKV